MTKKTMPDNEKLIKELQDPNRYKDVILQLRSKNNLHDFFEWALEQIITQAFGNRFSIQPEKYGISNGRVDMALYHTPRNVIHFELIATCHNGHVFRDTTSLLASRSDEQLAILIDQDLESGVADNFFKAIPDGQVKFVFLREALLDVNRQRFVEIVRDLIASAEFKNGSTDPSRFYCAIQNPHIAIFTTVQLEYNNAPIGGILTVQLQQHESMFKTENLASLKIENQRGSLTIPIPYFYNAPGESYYLAAYLSTGERWRKRVYLAKRAEPPTAVVSPGMYSPLSAVSFVVRNFPAGATIRTCIVREGIGQGCNHGQEVVTDANGSASGTFRVPHFINATRIQTGEYGLTVSTENSPFNAHVETTVNLIAAKASEQLWRELASGTHNHFASASLRGLGFRKDEIEIEHQLVNLSSIPLTYMGVSVDLRDNDDEQSFTLFLGGACKPTLLQPGQSEVRKDRFVPFRQDKIKGNSALVLRVSWTLAIESSPEELGQMFSFHFEYTLWQAEAEVFLGKE